MNYGIKCVSSKLIETEAGAGYGGWVKTDRGWESWCKSMPFVMKDLNQAFAAYQSWIAYGEYTYFVEEIPDEIVAKHGARI